MVLPLFHFANASSLNAGQKFVLDGAEGKHAASVRRLRAGEKLQVTDGSGARVECLVLESSNSSLDLEVMTRTEESLGVPSITLVQALAKSDRDELAIQAATELGASKILPWAANRSVSKWVDDKKAKGKARWQTIVNEAAKQSLRVWNPEVLEIADSKHLSSELSKHDLVLVLDPMATQGLTEIDLNVQSIAIVVGPEGGIEPGELAELESRGAKRVHLGAGVLRTSTAGMAVIAWIQGKTGHWA